METATASPKYQVVIPLRVRQALGIHPRQKVRVILYKDRVELIPVRPVRESRGMLRGIETCVEREEDRL